MVTRRNVPEDPDDRDLHDRDLDDIELDNDELDAHAQEPLDGDWRRIA